MYSLDTIHNFSTFWVTDLAQQCRSRITDFTLAVLTALEPN